MPLEHLRVVDLTRVRAGPTCVRQLADWGAQVIKVEGPEIDSFGGAREGPDFQNLHRNKRSMTVNLKEPEGRAILLKLVEQADILVENYRPDVKDRLKIDYETLRKVNPRLIYASISGFGQDGPYRDRPGVDQIAQGMGGLMSITGEPGRGPMRVGIAIADVSAGVFAAMGILIAVIEREKSGEGQWVQSSLLQAQIAMLDFQAARWLLKGEIPEQVGNDHPTGVPTSAYPTADGYINVAAPADYAWKRLCNAIEAPHLIDRPGFDSFLGRQKNRHAVNEALSEILKTRTSEEWVTILNDAGVPCGPIYTMDQVFADPQVKHLGIAQDVPHPKLGKQTLVGQAVTLSRTPSSLRTPTPDKGEHTSEILRDLGYDDAKIADLKSRGVL
jgi:formyl-CoA transferase